MDELTLKSNEYDDILIVNHDKETGDFLLGIGSEQGDSSIALDRSSAKKLQAFINKNAKEGGRKL